MDGTEEGDGAGRGRFIRPEDYSTEYPIVVIGGIRYTLHKNVGSLVTRACPHAVTEAMRRIIGQDGGRSGTDCLRRGTSGAP